MLRSFAILAAVGAFCVAPESPLAAAPPARTGPVSFINDIAPLFKENCFACHDAKKRKGKLDMTTFENLRKGGDNDDPIVAGKPDESLIVDLIAAKGSRRMPPKETGDPLPAEKVALVKQWIAEGAKLDAALQPKSDLLRELRVRWNPPAPPATYKFPVTVTALAFSPDGKKLVVGGHHELTVWDLAAAKLEKRISTRAERAKALVFLPDGKLVVAGGRPGQEGDVRIYDLNGGQPKMVNGVAVLDGVHDPKVMLKQLVDSDDEILCLGLSADGKKLACGGCDRLVHIWDLSNGFAKANLEQKIENHADWVLAVTFSPNGKQLLTASRDKTAKVWDLEKKESLLTFPDHQNPVYGVAIKPDGKVAFSVGADKLLRVWNVATEGKQIRAAGGHGNEVFKVLYVAGKTPSLVTCGADNTVRVWSDNGTAARTLSGHTDWVYALAVSPDGSQAASGSWNGEVKVWKLADGAPVTAFNASPGFHQVAAAPPAKKADGTKEPPAKK
jgi:WD40 repeat protein